MLVLFLIVFVGLVGFGLILPLFPFYAIRFGASPEVVTLTMAGFTMGQVIATPLWGRVGDAWGRRPVLILTMFGATLAYLVLAVAPNLAVVIASRVFGGLMAGNVSAALAYVADITTTEDRAAGLGKVSAGIGLGFMIGPALGGFLAGADVATASFAAPALAAAAMSFIAMLATLAFLPESLPPEHRRPWSAGRRQSGGQSGGQSGALNGGGFVMFGTRRAFRYLAIVGFMFFLASSLMEAVFPLWAHDVLGRGPRFVGSVFFVLGGLQVVVQGALIGPLTRRLGEKPLAIIAAAVMAAGFAVLASAATPQVMWVGIVLFGVGVGTFNATVSSLVSKTAGPGERGAVMGLFQSAGASGRVLGPAVSGLLYSKISFAGPFMAAALTMLPTLALMAGFRPDEPPLPARTTD